MHTTSPSLPDSLIASESVLSPPFVTGSGCRDIPESAGQTAFRTLARLLARQAATEAHRQATITDAIEKPTDS
jgi:hypothetical protein